MFQNHVFNFTHLHDDHLLQAVEDDDCCWRLRRLPGNEPKNRKKGSRRKKMNEEKKKEKNEKDGKNLKKSEK